MGKEIVCNTGVQERARRCETGIYTRLYDTLTNGVWVFVEACRVLKGYSQVPQPVAAMCTTTPAVADHFFDRGFGRAVAAGNRQRFSGADSFDCGPCMAAERGPQLMPLLPRARSALGAAGLAAD